MQLLSAIQAPSAIKACSAIQACSGITAIPAVEEEVVAFTNTYSVDFDGVDDYVDCGDVAEINNASTITIQAWIKLDNTNNVFYIISKYLDNNNRIHIGGSSNAIYFNVSNGGGQYGIVPYTSTDWNHVALVFNGNLSGNENRLKAYINGVQQSLSFSGTIQSTLADLSGQSLQLFKQGSYYGNGKIDEVAVFTSALSGAQVSAIYNSGVPADLTSYSPVGWWRMGDNDGATGTTITDQGSGGNNGTLTNGPTFSTDIPVYVFNRYSVDFDGVDDYLAVADAAELSFGDASTDSPFSISAWVKSDNWNKFRVVAKGNTTTDAEFIFGGDGASKLALYMFDAAHAVNIGRSYNTILNTGQWYHVGVTYDGSGVNTGIELYVDGVKLTSVTNQGSGSYTAMHNTTGELSIGRSYIPDYGSGLIDEVAIFSSELSEADMTAIYNDGEPSDISSYSPIGWWRMGDNDDGTGTTITDQGSGGNNGTLTNGPTFSTDVPT